MKKLITISAITSLASIPLISNNAAMLTGFVAGLLVSWVIKKFAGRKER